MRRVSGIRVAGEFGAAVVVIVGLALGVRRFAAPGSEALWWAVVVVAALAYGAGTLLVLRGAPPRASRRGIAYLLTVSGVLSVLLVVALCYRRDSGIGPSLGSPLALLMTVATACAVALLIARLASLVGWLAPRIAGLRPFRALRETRPWSYGVILLVLLAMWLPALILLAPGSVTYDGARQLDELLGVSVPSLDFTYVPTNHHPWFATLWQGSLFRVGMWISGGNVNAGLLVHSLVLVSASLLTYAYVVRRIQSLTGDRGWTLLALLFFGVLPHFANYAMLYEKTGWYQLALLWFFLGVVDVALSQGTAASRSLQLTVGGTLAALFRSNGIYIVIPALIVLAVLLLGNEGRRRLAEVAVAGLVAVTVFFGWTNIALPRLGVAPASPAEALVLPFQQVARIVLSDGASLTPAQLATIDAVLPVDELRAAYNAENGDGVKSLYEIDSFLITDSAIEKMRGRADWWRGDDTERRAKLTAFLLLWPQLVLQHPGTALSATIQNTYLYYAPVLNRGMDVSLFSGGLPTYEILANPTRATTGISRARMHAPRSRRTTMRGLPCRAHAARQPRPVRVDRHRARAFAPVLASPVPDHGLRAGRARLSRELRRGAKRRLPLYRAARRDPAHRARRMVGVGRPCPSSSGTRRAGALRHPVEGQRPIFEYGLETGVVGAIRVPLNISGVSPKTGRAPRASTSAYATPRRRAAAHTSGSSATRSSPLATRAWSADS